MRHDLRINGGPGIWKPDKKETRTSGISSRLRALRGLGRPKQLSYPSIPTPKHSVGKALDC